ncbi:MAG: DUF962 domain-containing protein [Gammaproteobacteria bacterium]|nr:DUF962 domain-containing protein [Gammaproteobacteria bacterium]
MSTPYTSFTEFWPFYVCEHSKATTRRWHFFGTATLFPLLILSVTYSFYLLLLLPLSGYGFAWYSHYFVEKNRPATFSYPLWSLLGDFKMFGLMCRRKMDAEVLRCENIMIGKTLEDITLEEDIDGM